jgi:perosamine synthetase
MTTLSSPQVLGRIPFARTPLSPDAIDAVTRVLQSGWLTTGPEVHAFEQEFAELVGSPHAVAVASCTSALELSLRSLHLPPGAPVLTPTITFCGAVNAILHAGLRPVLVDAAPDTLMPDAVAVRAAVARAGQPSAAVVLHFAGHPAPVRQIAEAAGLPLTHVVEDAAHAVGTLDGQRPVGTTSRATCFSFYATKNLPIGEGGMVTTSYGDVAEFVRRSRLHGMSKDAWKRYLPGATWRYGVEEAGLKANMTDLQGAIGRAQLGRLGDWQVKRARLAERYDAGLRDIEGIARPARPHNGVHAWHLYVIRVLPPFGMSRDLLMAAMSERGVDCSVHFIPVHQQPYMERLLGPASDPRHFPVAETVGEQILSLPLYPGLSDEDVDRVCDVLRSLSAPPGPLAHAHLREGERST